MDMLSGAMLVWFTLSAASVVFVICDSIVNGVTSWVQRIAWILVTLYAGPVGLFFYLMACRRPFPGAHDEYTKPLWKQAVNSEMHCLAGDATGVIAAAALLATVGLANGWEITIEYLVAFVCGLFIFQALMMRGMYGGDYAKAVRKTFFAETVSMNMVMTGMIPVMVLLASAWPGSTDPARPSFWFRMGLATIAGGVVAYPINCWMVARHLKHGCMTLPGADRPAPHLGHRSPEAMHDMPHMKMGGMKMAEKAAAPKPAGAAKMAGMEMGDMDMGSMDMGSMDMAGMDMGGMHGMHMGELPSGKAVAVIAATFVVLFAALVLTARFTPISFS